MTTLILFYAAWKTGATTHQLRMVMHEAPGVTPQVLVHGLTLNSELEGTLHTGSIRPRDARFQKLWQHALFIEQWQDFTPAPHHLKLVLLGHSSGKRGDSWWKKLDVEENLLAVPSSPAGLFARLRAAVHSFSPTIRARASNASLTPQGR